MTTETIPFDAARYLSSPEDQAELLCDALVDGNANYIAAALNTILRARDIPPAIPEQGCQTAATT